MNILFVSNQILPAVKYGGTQRIITSLMKEFSLMGHSVCLLAPRNSSNPFGKFYEYNTAKPISAQIPSDVDIVHLHYYDGSEIKIPHVLTIHGLGIPADEKMRQCCLFVSRSHAERFGSDQFVYNGLDWSEYGKPDLSLERRHYHFLGKAAWKAKNLAGAIDLTKHLPGGELDVLGGSRLNFSMGFRLTLSPRIHFFGMVDNAKKKKIIERSRGLLFPIQWSEPFGLSVIESLYFGSPAFTTPYGAMPEIITSEVGFMTTSADMMLDHIKNSTYSPKICHEYAADTFNSRRMAESYLQKYETVMNHGKLTEQVLSEFTKQLDRSWKKLRECK